MSYLQALFEWNEIVQKYSAASAYANDADRGVVRLELD